MQACLLHLRVIFTPHEVIFNIHDSIGFLKFINEPFVFVVHAFFMQL
jgi:hypothetical protein